MLTAVTPQEERKIMNKKIFSLFALFTVFALVLTGCAPKDGEGSGSGSTNKDYDLLVWEDIEKTNGIADAVAKFEELHDVKVQVVEKAYAKQNEDLRLDGPAGIGPDVITIPGDQIGTLVLEGLLHKMTLTDAEKDAFTDVALESQTVAGEVYGLPKAVETIVMYYNKDLVDEANLPETLNEWYDFSEKVVGDGQYGFLTLWDQIYYAQSVFSASGGYIFGENADGSFNTDDIGLATSGVIEAATRMQEFYTNEIFPAGIIGEQGITVLDTLFSEGKAAAVISGPWNANPFKEAGIDYGVVALPKLDSGEHMSAFVGVKSYNVSSYSKNSELAEEFVKFIANEENSKVRFEKTNEVPALKVLVDNPAVAADPVAKAVAEQSQYSELTPSIPEMNEVWTPVDSALQTIATGSDVKTALEQAVELIKSQIAANHSN